MTYSSYKTYNAAYAACSTDQPIPSASAHRMAEAQAADLGGDIRGRRLRRRGFNRFVTRA